MSAQVAETCREAFGCKIAIAGKCAGAGSIRSEGKYIGADITPPETRERAEHKLGRFKLQFGPVCQDQDELKAAVEEVEKKIREYAWPPSE